MEQKNELQLFRMRSNRGAIADGYRLFLSNFRPLLRATWIVAVVYALITAIFTKCYITLLPQLLIMRMQRLATYDMGWLIGAMTPFLVTFFLLMLASVALLGGGFAAFREHAVSNNISRPAHWYGSMEIKTVLRLLLVLLAITLLTMIPSFLTGIVIAVGRMYLGTLATKLLAGLLWLLSFVAYLPVAYPFYQYMLTPNARLWPTLAAGYRTGLRHWGALFVVTLITSIITAVLSSLAELPAIILGMANLNSQLGTLLGDPAGMPDYMGWMTTVVFTIAGFIMAYVNLSALFPFYYLYGSVETREEERRKMVSEGKTTTDYSNDYK